MRKNILMVLFFVLPLICFAQDKPEGSSSNKKMQDLKQFLSDHKGDIKQTDEAADMADKNILQIFSYFLDDQQMPVMLQAFNFLLLGSSPEYWDNMKTAEETAQIYFKILKHSNPVVRLCGLTALQKMRERIKNPQEGQSDKDIQILGQIISIIEVEYVPSTQDKKLFEQYQKCYFYLAPIFNQEKDKSIDTPGFIAAFDSADRTVQFYLTFKLTSAFMWSHDEEIRKLMVKVHDKGDVYIKGLVAESIMDEEQISELFRNLTNPDEFITLGTFLNSSNSPIPLGAWPDKEELEALYNSASPRARQILLKLMETSSDFWW